MFAYGLFFFNAHELQNRVKANSLFKGYLLKYAAQARVSV